MPERLEVTLSPAAAVSANDTSETVDLGSRRRAVLLPVVATSFTGTGSVRVFLETSKDQSSWRSVQVEDFSAGIPERALSGFDLDRHVRLRWEVAGTASVTLVAVGSAHTIYATPTQLGRLGAPTRSFEEVSAYEQLEACVAASEEADGYIGNAYRLPLTSWGLDLTKHVAALAVELIFCSRGIDPDGPDAVVLDRRNRAVQWLDRLGQGRLSPPDLIDSTPEEFEGVCVVVSQPPRGSWL